MRISAERHKKDLEKIRILEDLKSVNEETIRLQKEQIRFMKNVITDQSSMIDKLFSVCRSLLGQLDVREDNTEAGDEENPFPPFASGRDAHV